MGAYRITGGTPLCGCVRIHGAKNSVLPILAATLLCRGECLLQNCPDITDVSDAIEILRTLGCTVTRDGETLRVNTDAAQSVPIPRHLMRKMRAAVIFLGPLMARFSKARLSEPGGCFLGNRPIDLHLRGLERMGAACTYEAENLICTAGRLKPCTLALPLPSVGATENLLLAALACEGETVLCNAAREPEITDLICFLRTCGADIKGDGTSVLRINGGKPLHGANYRILPDRMEAATYLAACAATRGSVKLCEVCPQHLAAVTDVLRRGGCEIEETQTELFISCSVLQAVSPISTAPYDGFPTDAQAPVMAAMATAEGISIFEETVFSDRLRHVPALRAMGAEILTVGRQAIVYGKKTLYGANVTATDLRGGAAMVIAALSAQGESRIDKTEHITRGYTAFDCVLRQLSANVTEEKD